MVNINEIKKLLVTIPEIKFAYLFGSYAKKTADSKSDVDIAVFVDEKFNLFDTKLKIHHALEITLNKDIDIVALNNVKNFNLLQDILDNNILLKESKDDFRIMFELSKEHEIMDYIAFKRMINVA